MDFSSKLVKTDITALLHIKNHILIGIGNCLHLHTLEDFAFAKKIQIFSNRQVFGLIPNEAETLLIVYGEKHIKVYAINLKCLTKLTELGYKSTNDWILNAIWLCSDRLATITMHNRLILYTTQMEALREYICDEKCILYSAYLFLNGKNDVIVYAGTVFNEIVVWNAKESSICTVKSRLKRHNGVIFCIDSNKDNSLICSSSDDRSTILWQIQPEITVKCQVYGHLSRIFRCKMIENAFITAGEDSLINLWSFNGELLKTFHQNSPIWALEHIKTNNSIISGCSDSSVVSIPLESSLEQIETKLPEHNPKSVVFLSDFGMAAFSDTANLFYYNQKTKSWLFIENIEDLRSYAVISVCSCRKLFALGGLCGQIHLYKHEKNRIKPIKVYHCENSTRIYSIHFLTCRTMLICQENGLMTLFYLKKDESMIKIHTFLLPPIKERWTTCALLLNDYILVGDRKGHLNLYKFGEPHPKQTLKRVFTHLGVTNLHSRDDKVIALGRNGIIKRFQMKNDFLQLNSSDKLAFSWLADVRGDFLYGFSGNKFVVWHLVDRRIVLEVDCGGGHRSWDCLVQDNRLKFVYIKEKSVKCVDFDLNLGPKNVLQSLHSNEINSLISFHVNGSFCLVSGGEDTVIRLSTVQDESFRKINEFKSHLSNVRALSCLKMDGNDGFWMVSGGGRAQIILWMLNFPDCIELHSYYEEIERNVSEMRIMDLVLVKLSEIYVFSGCSDGFLKVFNVINNKLVLYRNVFYKLKCIMKLLHVKEANLLLTMATDGSLVCWDVNDLLDLTIDDVKPRKEFRIHQSGVNSCCYVKLGRFYVVLSGGDDNCINLLLLNRDFECLDRVQIDGGHCSQITGTYIVKDSFLTISIDQKLCFFEYSIKNDKLICNFVNKMYTNVSDVQGFSCSRINSQIHVFIYGNGLEYIVL